MVSTFNSLPVENESDRDDGTAMLTAVTGLAVIFRLKALEISAFHPVYLIALGAVTIGNLFFVNHQMAVATSEFVAPRGEQHQCFMSAS